MTNLAGLHDRESTEMGIPDTWVLDTVALSENPTPPSYDRAYAWIVRLNWGYGSTGTLPTRDRYADFAARVAAYVAGSSGCSRWVIGNEPNLPREWPDGVPILPDDYADAYRRCRNAIRALPGHERDEVLVAGPGPWNDALKYADNPSGDWVFYLADVVEALGLSVDGFSLHAYTHGVDAALVTSEARMDAPFAHRRYEFRVYQDLIDAVPHTLHHLPFYLTEANGNGPWRAVGLMPAMLAEIDAFNQRGLPKFRAVIFYRYPPYDDHAEFAIQGKPDVIAEYRAAVGRGYQSPPVGKSAVVQEQTHLPYTPNQSSSVAVPDSQPQAPTPMTPRLVEWGATLTPAQAQSGQAAWRIIFADGPFDRGGNHHIYVDVLDEERRRVVGVPVEFYWDGKAVQHKTEAKPGEDQATNEPMYAGGNAYGVRVADGTPSDDLFGMGMVPFEPHKSYRVVFQRKVDAAVPAPAPTQEPQATMFVGAPDGAYIREHPVTGAVLTAVPYGDPVAVLRYDANGWANVRAHGFTGWMRADLLRVERPAAPTPTEPSPAPSGDKWQRVIEFILREEGGYTANDEGAPANFGINQGANPDLDVANITRDQAIERYRTKYWQGSGADKLEWPFCLFVMNASVQAGQDAALQLVAESGGNMLRFQGLFQLFYSRINQDSWGRNGKAWMARCGRLLVEASKP